jgi:hypothetical protein
MVHLGQEAPGGDGQWAATLEDGARVSAETLRRVACDCALVATSGEGDGQRMNIGRRSRSIPTAIRRTLITAASRTTLLAVGQLSARVESVCMNVVGAA